MKKLFAIVCLGVCALAQADERPSVSRYANAYSGDEGISVIVVRVGAPEQAEALVQISGVDHPQDGLIQKTRIESRNQGQERRYLVNRNGQDVLLFSLERQVGTVHLTPLPNNIREPHVNYDQALSSQTNPEHVLSAWLKQNRK